MDTIDTVLAAADRAWREHGVSAADRAALAADLGLDLRAAAADGRGPAELLGGDVAAFARRVADEAGVPLLRHDYGRVAGTAMLGAAAGFVLGFLVLQVVYGLFVRAFDLPRSVHVPAVLAAGVYFAGLAVLVTTAAAVTVRWWLRDLPQIRRTARLMGLLMPAGGAVAVGFAWSTGFSTFPLLVVAEIAVVLAALAGAAIVARRWSLRPAL